MAVLIVCGVDAQGQPEILVVEPMLAESKESYSQLPQKEKDAFAFRLKKIWLASSVEIARRRSQELAEQ